MTATAASQGIGTATSGSRQWRRFAARLQGLAFGLEAAVRASLPESVTCPSCGGPACPDCGQAMTVLVPVPVPAPASVTEQVTRLIDGYRQRHPEVTGDDT